MEPRRTQLCMLSDMLSSCLTLIVKHCNASTYKLPLPQKRANELGPEGVPRRRSGEMESPHDPRRRSICQGRLARSDAFLLDLELL